MTRSNRRFAAAAVRECYVCAFRSVRGPASVRAWSARACGVRDVATAERRCDRVVAQRLQSVAPTFRGRS
eukprot:9772072-Lingulodinium_polyedra.AAC.1